MDRGNTKQEILDVALELFSVKGFEATSLSTIADAVGIRKASLYSHFENKQAILDALVEEVLRQYNTRSLFARANWDDAVFRKEKSGLSLEDITNLVKEQIRFILHDPYISKARKMLMIEQFQNSELAKLQTKQNYTDVMQYFTGLMQFCME
ncbi:MAG: TetR/AcrR family transcriptional regulator, partial [Anaerotignum sp.]